MMSRGVSYQRHSCLSLEKREPAAISFRSLELSILKAYQSNERQNIICSNTSAPNATQPAEEDNHRKGDP